MKDSKGGLSAWQHSVSADIMTNFKPSARLDQMI